MPVSSLDKLRRFVQDQHDLSLALLFGSTGSPSETSASDIDLAVACGRIHLTPERKQELIENVAELLGRPVDLIDLNQTHALLLKQILTQGRILLCRDQNQYADLIRRMFYEQADFQPYIDRILVERRKKWINI